MGTIFSISPDKSLLLYANASSVYFRTAVGMDITKPLILCNDFSDSLSTAICHDTIYFSYQNTNKDIILRSILDNQIIFFLSAKEAPQYSSPTIISHKDTLLLFFFVENPLSGKLILKYNLPLNSSDTFYDIGSFLQLPSLQFMTVNDLLLLNCQTISQSYLFFKNEQSFEPVFFKTQQELQMQKDKNNTILLEKETELLQKNTKLGELEKELRNKIDTIASARTQYDTLMNTAYRYKEEAEKWYTRYYSKK